jgi:SMI1 / KNR4 family (SUKH-1)
MQDQLEEISRKHFPNPPATLQEIEAFEQRVGWRLDADLRAFYLHCNGADLFKRPGSPYIFLPLSEITRARAAILGEDTDQYGPPSLYTVCDVQDGDFILVDVAERHNERFPIIDGWHEGFPDPKYLRRIANSFSEFLTGALRSEGFQFWLSKGRGGA